MELPTRLRSWRFKRDSLILTVGISLLVHEVTIGGRDPAVVVALITLILSPAAMRDDEKHKKPTKP